MYNEPVEKGLFYCSSKRSASRTKGNLASRLRSKTKFNNKSERGFTLVEMVLVVTILGILAISALPSFTNVTTQAEMASRDAVLSAIQTSLQLYRANDMAQNGPPGNYPAILDDVADNANCAPATPCFGNVMQAPIGDYKSGRGWAKTNDTTYRFNDGTSTYTFLYTPAAGTFSQQ